MLNTLLNKLSDIHDMVSAAAGFELIMGLAIIIVVGMCGRCEMVLIDLGLRVMGAGVATFSMWILTMIIIGTVGLIAEYKEQHVDD